MLLNYLYANFLEEHDFARACGLSEDGLAAMMENQIIPSASYTYSGHGRSTSFVSDFHDETVCRFHLKGHVDWQKTVTRLGLNRESDARAHFFQRYNNAMNTFFTNVLGQQLSAVEPDIENRFNSEHANATWRNFLDGVYGVCTRDGQPESIFQKQVGVMFVEHLIAGETDELPQEQLDLLARTVSFLDAVASEFAPHETAISSRQRCIIDVRARFLGSTCDMVSA
ncbi:MAG: DUF6058 family natural product biosynthesis protein [Pseudomonadota bacterium]